MDMLSVMSMKTALKGAAIQGGAKRHTESAARVVKAEMNQVDGDTEDRREKLRDLETKAKQMEDKQMGTLSGINQEIREAAEKEREEHFGKSEEKKTSKKEGAERTSGKDRKTEAPGEDEEQAEPVPGVYTARGFWQIPPAAQAVPAPEAAAPEASVDVRV